MWDVGRPPRPFPGAPRKQASSVGLDARRVGCLDSSRFEGGPGGGPRHLAWGRLLLAGARGGAAGGQPSGAAWAGRAPRPHRSEAGRHHRAALWEASGCARSGTRRGRSGGGCYRARVCAVADRGTWRANEDSLYTPTDVARERRGRRAREGGAFFFSAGRRPGGLGRLVLRGRDRRVFGAGRDRREFSGGQGGEFFC